MSHAGCNFELEIHEVKRSEESEEKERKVAVQRKEVQSNTAWSWKPLLKKGKSMFTARKCQKHLSFFNYTCLEIAPVSILAEKLDTASAFPRLRSISTPGTRQWKSGSDVVRTCEGWTDASTCSAHTIIVWKVQGSDMSPREITVKLAPNETRSVEASFIHSGLNTGLIAQGVFPGYAAHHAHAEADVPTATPAPGRKVGHGKKNKHHPVHTSGKQT